MKRQLLIFLGLFPLNKQTFTQEKAPVKFGKVSTADFIASYNIDSSSSAVIIADVGSTEMVDNNRGGFALEFKNYRRARILNKNGYDIANVVIPLYTDGGNEEKQVKIAKINRFHIEQLAWLLDRLKTQLQKSVNKQLQEKFKIRKTEVPHLIQLAEGHIEIDLKRILSQ